MKIGFICTGNSARSQMSEGFGKYYAKKYKKNIDIYSAGSRPSGYVHPMAIEVMAEKGIDILANTSKHINDIPVNELDYVITLCGDAAEECPVVPGANTQHWGLPDPAKAIGTQEEQLASFRKIRDEIGSRIDNLIKSL